MKEVGFLRLQLEGILVFDRTQHSRSGGLSAQGIVDKLGAVILEADGPFFAA
ncbi:MAG: hypothetical protein SOZ49_01465 [Clostridiaceae bacterium]|nr:hypothetical protein [Clostridiaceae bacterium]